MKIKHLLENGSLRIYLYGELDECTAQKTRELIDEIINKNSNINSVVFNFSGMTFMDSTGIGMLIGRYKKIKSKNLSTYIENPTRQVDKILEISGLYKIMPKI